MVMGNPTSTNMEGVPLYAVSLTRAHRKLTKTDLTNVYLNVSKSLKKSYYNVLFLSSIHTNRKYR